MNNDTFELEKQALAGLLKADEIGDDVYNNAGVFLEEQDFSSKTREFHGPILSLIKQARENGKRPNKVLLAQQLTDLRISFKSDLSPLQYLESLELYRTTSEASVEAIRELKKYSIGRKMVQTARTVEKLVTSKIFNTDIHKLIELVDQTYHSGIKDFLEGKDSSINIYEQMERIVEERGNNPLLENGPTLNGWPRLNGIYGSLWTPEDITVIVARSGIGKTTLALDFNAQISAKYQIPVIHFDNGEMSDQKLTFRQCAAETGVPLFAIETGRWRQNETFTKLVRDFFVELKKRPKPIIYYVDVGGKSVSEMINIARRIYFSKIGRGNPAILSYDYIKTSFESSNKEEHQAVGEMIDKFKQFIKTEMKFDGKPVISMFTSVQANRYGEGDNAVSLSDRIKQFSSVMFLLSKKTPEELMEEPLPVDGRRIFGTHKLTNLKCRNMGEFNERHSDLVKMPDGTLKQNHINLTISNFKSTENGDLKDMVDYINGNSKAV